MRLVNRFYRLILIRSSLQKRDYINHSGGGGGGGGGAKMQLNDKYRTCNIVRFTKGTLLKVWVIINSKLI